LANNARLYGQHLSVRKLTGEKRSGIIFLTCIAVALGVVGLFAFSLMLYRMQLSAQSANYLSVEGVIEESEIRQEHRFRRPVNQKPHITYRYEIDGKSYLSHRFSYADPYGDASESSAQEFIERYPRGKRVAVYYDPAHHAESILHQSTWRDFLFLLTTGSILLMASIIGLYYIRKLARIMTGAQL
jgi:Protein of unknown function (DUF3592)